MSRRADGRWSGDPERNLRHDKTDKGRARKNRYHHSVKGIQSRIREKVANFERETGVKV
jgi:hypothetical protein